MCAGIFTRLVNGHWKALLASVTIYVRLEIENISLAEMAQRYKNITCKVVFIFKRSYD